MPSITTGDKGSDTTTAFRLSSEETNRKTAPVAFDMRDVLRFTEPLLPTTSFPEPYQCRDPRSSWLNNSNVMWSPSPSSPTQPPESAAERWSQAEERFTQTSPQLAISSVHLDISSVPRQRHWETQRHPREYDTHRLTDETQQRYWEFQLALMGVAGARRTSRSRRQADTETRPLEDDRRNVVEYLRSINASFADDSDLTFMSEPWIHPWCQNKDVRSQTINWLFAVRHLRL